MRKCPHCAEEIQEDAKKCRHCGEWFAAQDIGHDQRAKNTNGKSYMEIEITWNRAVQVWWSYLWRSLIAGVVSMIIGMIIGGIIGFIMGAMDFPILAIQLIAGLLGLVIGLGISVVPMKMILGKDFGEFHLVLLAKQTPVGTPSTTPQVIQ